MNAGHVIRATMPRGALLCFTAAIGASCSKGLEDAVALLRHRSRTAGFSMVRWATMAAIATLMAAGFNTGPASAQQCFWDGTPPFCAGSCPSGYNVTKKQACLSGHKVLCCEKLGSQTSDGPGQPYLPARTTPARPCPTGLVWRERFDGDTVCVTPGERDNNRRRRGLPVAVSACPPGLVWREQFDGDTFCVTPTERDANRRRRGLPVGR